MIYVNDLIEYGERIVELIETINFSEAVIDETQLVKKIGERYPEDNFLLFMVIPSMANQGKDDAVIKNNAMAFMLLKISDNQQSHEEFLEEMQETQQAAYQLETRLHLDKEDNCGIMRWLEAASIEIDPVWNYAGCNGWSFKFFMNTNL